MSTREVQRHTSSGFLWAVLGFIALIWAMRGVATLSLQVVPVNGVNVTVEKHAIEKHGDEAIQAAYCLQTGKPPKHFDCRGGKEYYIKAMSTEGLYAIEPRLGGHPMTCFPGDAKYVKHILRRDGCTPNPWRGGSGPMYFAA